MRRGGLAHAAGVRCGPICLATPGFEHVAAAMCGGAAILFVKLYAGLTSAVQRTFIDPFKHVRPEPPKEQARSRCISIVHVKIPSSPLG